MSQTLFFKKLSEELKNHPYKERFLEELQDHLEDAKESEPKKITLLQIYSVNLSQFELFFKYYESLASVYFFYSNASIIDYVFSADEKWLLLKLSESAFGSQGVYLLKVDQSLSSG